MAIVSFGSVAPNAIVGATFTPISLAAATFSAGNWNGDTPGNLSAIADGNSTTATTWGRTHGGGNKGWIHADIGQLFNRIYVETKIGLRMNSGWDGGSATWTIEGSADTQIFLPLWQIGRFRPTSVERTITLNFWGNLRYLRATAEDVGDGQAELRWYDLRVWQLSL